MSLNARTSLIVAAVAWFGVLLVSTAMTKQPIVFGDEAGYLLPTLFGSSAENYARWSVVVQYPSYIYFWLYGLLPHGDLHEWAKGLNSAFVAATACPGFLVARRYLPQPIAALFAVALILLPISSFARYVMTEPMYFFGFWCVLAIVLTTLDRAPIVAALTGGLAAGALSLVKPHAVAIALAMSVFLLLRRPSAKSVAAAVIQFAAFYLTHALLGLVLTGAPLWSISGGSYTGVLQGGGIDWPSVVFNAAGHAAALLALLGPLVVLPLMIAPQPDARYRELGLLALLLTVTMVAMTVYFSQSVYHGSEIERISRLHGRYYLYTFPLYVLLGAAVLTGRATLRGPVAVLIAALLAAPVCAVIVHFIYETSPVDFPDLALLGRKSKPAITAAVIFLQIGVAIWACYSGRPRRMIAAAIGFFATVELLTTIGLIVVAPIRSFDLKPVDRVFLQSPLPGDIASLIGRPDGAIVAPAQDGSELARALFYMKGLSRGLLLPPAVDTASDADLPQDARWALLLPGVSYTGSHPATRTSGATIVTLK